MTTTTIILSLLGVIGYVSLIVFIVRDAGYLTEDGEFISGKDWKHLRRMDAIYH